MRLRQYPSLVNCTTIDWFLDWPKEALLEVAFKSLTTIEVLETITGAPRVCIKIFKIVFNYIQRKIGKHF